MKKNNNKSIKTKQKEIFTVENYSNTSNLYTFIISLLITFISISGISSLHAEELLQNGDFSKSDPVINNSQIAWQLYLPGNPKGDRSKICSFKDGTVNIKTTNEIKKVFLLQRNIVLTPYQSYQLSYEVKSSNSSLYKVYIEWISKDKSFHTCPPGKTIVAPTKWEKISFDFTFNDINVHIVPYLGVVLAGTENGEASFRNFSLKKIKKKRK